MTRPAAWKVFTVGAALTGLGMVGAGAAVADPGMPPAANPAISTSVGANFGASLPLAESTAACSNRGAQTTHCQTNGSSQIYTAPNPRNNAGGIYGPFFFQTRGLGGAAAIGR